jgi:hypothetical protein
VVVLTSWDRNRNYRNWLLGSNCISALNHLNNMNLIVLELAPANPNVCASAVFVTELFVSSLSAVWQGDSREVIWQGN